MKFFRRAQPAVRALRTARLDLVPITEPMLQAEDWSPERLGSLLRAAVPEGWPPEHWEPHVRAFIALQYKEQPETLGWHRYVVLRSAHKAGNQLVGCVGAFPKPGGEVEIGYATLSLFQRRGFATEAARALMEWLLEQEGVLAVTAQTYATLPESIKVMERCGMLPAGAGDEAGTVRYRRMRSSTHPSFDGTVP